MRRFAFYLAPLASLCRLPLQASEPAAAQSQALQSDIIAQAVADPARPAGYRAADEFRKPAETIAFSGVRPGIIVGEFYPAGGYFTRMLSDVVGPAGHIYAIEKRAGTVGQGRPRDARRGQMEERLARRPAVRNREIREAARHRLGHQNYHDLKIPSTAMSIRSRSTGRSMRR